MSLKLGGEALRCLFRVSAGDVWGREEERDDTQSGDTLQMLLDKQRPHESFRHRPGVTMTELGQCELCGAHALL